jgi:cobalt-zinc-cadmium efflux system membrane fusion protein
VQQLDGVPVVFVAEGEDTYRRRLVEVGRTEDGLTEIRSGLKPGELVVGKGAFLLKSTIVLQSHPEEP